MRTLALSLLFLFALAPHAFAQTGNGCNSIGDSCVYSGADGTCAQNPETGDLYCRPNALGPTSGGPTAGITDPFASKTAAPAQSPSTAGKITLVNPLGTTNLMQLLGAILDFVIRLGTVVIVFMLIFVGFKFVTAQGNESQITAAREMLLWTLVGALILLGAKAISIGLCATVNALSTGGTLLQCAGL